jgi:microcin C transport system substrate-binding protein
MAHAFSLSRRSLLQALPLGLVPWARSACAADGYALYGAPKYPPGFSYFNYVNPQAPIGGTLWLTPPSSAGSFDKLNPFTLRGTAPPGLGSLVFETLMTPSWDEPNSIYGLLAEDIEVAADGLSVRFRLHPAAKFSTGDAVTAADVCHSFNTLTGSSAAPGIKVQFGDVARVVAEDAQHVRFLFRRANHELPLIAAGMPVFSHKWGAGKTFDQVVSDPPVASGPYRIERMSQNRDIIYARRDDYWGWMLPTRRGQFNFARIGYKLYRDDTARLEAFKAGDFDLIQEFIAKNWVRQYNGPKFQSGELIKRALANHNPAGFQGMVMNLRRPLFQDSRVREALALALDFQWLNRMLFYGQYTRIHGYFANSPFEAKGAPDADELALLEPLRAQLRPTVFGPLPTLPSTDRPGSLRANLLAARSLLRASGWHYRGGALRNARGEAFAFEYLDSQGSMARVMAPYAQALEKLGISMQYRQVDFALYQRRMDRFEFDMTTVRYLGSPSPGNELRDRFGSAAASVEGSDNVWGVRSAAVDVLIGHVVRAQTWAQLVAACRALDRVLVCGWYSVPQWYAAQHRVAYRAKRFGMPDTLPLYYEPESWAIACWWALAPQLPNAESHA